ncbi:inositol monophosphatase [Candidatus Saccharibacteria bacterium]|nr:inositol monophosphatase [Candidatus Saccharibacteria bacterium]
MTSGKESIIADFFHTIGPEIISLTKRSLDTNSVSVEKKHSSDFATQLDIDVERYITAEIQKAFAGDIILAEEEHRDTPVGEGRVWIIDPICGTNNLGRGIAAYCSNIALAVDGELVASCVVDLAQHEYYWSTGGGVIYRGNHMYEPQKPVSGTVVDVDFGCIPELPQAQQASHSAAVRWLEVHTDYVFVSFNTSLSFLYVALHRLDGVMNIAVNAWDVAAAAFLGTQSGCVVSQSSGEQWELESGNIVMAIDEKTHSALVEALESGFSEKGSEKQ